MQTIGDFRVLAVRKHLSRFANTNSYTDVYSYGNAYCYSYPNRNPNGYSHSDSNADRHDNAYSDTDGNSDANRDRVCVRTRLLEESSCSMAGNTATAWQCYL